MQDYHIYAHYSRAQSAPPTSPKTTTKEPKTVVVEKVVKEKIETEVEFPKQLKAAAAIALVTANKINSYVGELTENRLQQRRVGVVTTLAGLALAIASNPIAGGIATAAYFGNAAINYQIKAYKQNLSADYLKQLSGGTVKIGR